MRKDENDTYQHSRRENLITLAISGVTLALLVAAGYLTPNLLAVAGH